MGRTQHQQAPRAPGIPAFWWAVALSTAVGTALRLRVWLQPLAYLDRILIPDDTYYTLTIARSLAHGLGPTTDGHVQTSGFQPLLAFLVVPFAWMLHSADALVRADLAICLVADVGTVVALAVLGRRLAGPIAGWAAATLWALSPAAIAEGAAGLETSLATFVELCFLIAVLAALRDAPSASPTGAEVPRRSERSHRFRPLGSRGRWGLAGVLAGLAVLARIDALALVGLVTLSVVACGRLRRLGPALLGGVAVLAPWWLWCTWQLGTPIPTSGSAAHALNPGAAFGAMSLSSAGTSLWVGWLEHTSSWQEHLVRAGTTWPFWLALVVAALVAVRLVVAAASAWQPGRRERLAIAATLPLWVVTLAVFYAWFGVTWYTPRYLAPAAAVVTLGIGALAGGFADAVGRWGAPPGPARVPWGAGIAVGAVLALALAHPISDGLGPLLDDSAPAAVPSPYQAATGYRAGALAVDRTVPRGAVIGALQSGALGYFAGRDHVVVNLDGVVSPPAAQARRDDRLPAYLHDRSVGWLADWSLFSSSLSVDAPRSGWQLCLQRMGLVAGGGGHPVEIHRITRLAQVAPTQPCP